MDADVALGWLSLTLHAWTEAERGPLLRRTLDALGESEPRPRAKGPQHYQEGLDVLSSSAIGWREDRPTELHLTLKQSDCSWPRFAALMEVADAASDWKVSRVDLNYDDARRVAEPGDVLDACWSGNVVTRVEAENAEGIAKNGHYQTAYVGARASDRYLCVYDKDAERAHALKQPVAVGTHGVRWELRLRDERATGVVRHIRDLVDVYALRESFWQAIVSLIDFRERPASARRTHHLEKLPRLAWFARLAGQLARQATYLPRPEENDAKRLWRLNHWLFHVSAAVAEWAEKHPDPLIVRELLQDGGDKLERRRARARAVIAVA